MLEENDRERGVTVSTMSQEEGSGDTQRSSGVEAALIRTVSRNVHLMAYSIYFIDEQYRIVQVDDRFQAITGYSREDVKKEKLTLLSLIFEEDRKEYLEFIRPENRKGEDLYLEHRLKRKDGTAIYVYCYGHSFYDSSVGESRARITIVNSDDPFGERQA